MSSKGKKRCALPNDEEIHTRKKQNTVQVGDEAEDFVLQQMKKFGELKDVERTGPGHKFDISLMVCHDRTRRGIQVKKLCRVQHEGKQVRYRASRIDRYPEDAAIICVNPEEQKAVMFFSHQRKPQGSSLLYIDLEASKGCRKPFYNQYIVPWSDFSKQLLEMATKSTVIMNDDDFLTPNYRSERQNTARCTAFLRSKTTKTVAPNKSHGDATDVFVGDLKLQLKSSISRRKDARPEAPAYQFLLRKSGPTNETGKRTKKPYALGDNDYYVFEITKPEHLQNQFLILPEMVLFEKGYLSDPATGKKGKTSFYVYPLEFTEQLAQLKANGKTIGANLAANWTCDPGYWYNSESEGLPF